MTESSDRLAQVGAVYRSLILKLMPEGWERDAVVADLDDVIALVDQRMAPPAPPERRTPVVEAARISTKDAEALRDGKAVIGFTPLT